MRSTLADFSPQHRSSRRRKLWNPPCVAQRSSHNESSFEVEDHRAQRMLERAATISQQLARLLPTLSTTEKAPHEAKWVRFGCKCNSLRSIDESDGVLLSDYLALEPSQYSLLDSSLVERMTSEDDGTTDCAQSSGTSFLVTLPVGDLLGAPALRPQIVVRATPKPESKQVVLVAESTLGKDEPLEATAKIQLSADERGVVSPSTKLRGVLEAEVEVLIPPPLSSLPRLAIRAFASLIANATAQALLPRFLELLETDFQRFVAQSSSSSEFFEISSDAERKPASGSSRTDDVGTLVSADDDIAARVEEQLRSKIVRKRSEQDEEGDKDEAGAIG